MANTEVKPSVMNRYLTAATQPVRDQLQCTPLDSNGYIGRHEKAWYSPRIGFENGIVSGIHALINLAVAHECMFDSKLADDYLVGHDYFRDMARGLRGMLNCEHGRLDAGFCDGAIMNIWREAGFTDEDL